MGADGETESILRMSHGRPGTISIPKRVTERRFCCFSRPRYLGHPVHEVQEEDEHTDEKVRQMSLLATVYKCWIGWEWVDAGDVNENGWSGMYRQTNSLVIIHATAVEIKRSLRAFTVVFVLFL
jgi:hypothetical protein